GALAFGRQALEQAVLQQDGVDPDAGGGGEGVQQRLDQAGLAGGVQVHFAGGRDGRGGRGVRRAGGVRAPATAAGGEQQRRAGGGQEGAGGAEAVVQGDLHAGAGGREMRMILAPLQPAACSSIASPYEKNR